MRPPHFPEPAGLRIRMEKSAALFASQVAVSTTPEEVFIDFASALMREEGGAVLPVHTRIAMTPTGAQRLLKALQTALEKAPQSAPATTCQTPPNLPTSPL